ncbi:MAG: TolB family protein, partial [Bacteroidales bacterium]
MKKLLFLSMFCGSVLSNPYVLHAAPQNQTVQTDDSKELEKQSKYIRGVIARLKKNDSFKQRIATAEQLPSVSEQINALKSITNEALQVYSLQTQLEWLDLSAIQNAMDDMAKMKGYDLTKNKQRFAELKLLQAKGFDGIYGYNSDAISCANRALELKKAILVDNPLLDMDKLVVGRYKLGERARHSNPPSLGTPPNNWSNQTSAAQTGFDAEIAVLSNLRGDISKQTIFKPQSSFSVPDLKLHWDADRILFSMPTENDHHWQVFEVGVDGKNLKQITNGLPEHLDFFDATYLPDGKIMAAANVGVHGVPCVNGDDEVGNFCIIDPKNNNIRRITFDQDANWGPVVMNNGRIMYVRWEYTDLTHYFSRIVMHMNPDGTEQRSLYGSGSVFPTSIYDVQPIPDHPTQFVGIISGHHGTQRSGRLIIFDPAISRKEEKGMVQELPFSQRPIIPIVKDEMVDGVWPQFLKPQPLNKDYHIVTAKLAPNTLWGIYLVDKFDNLTLIHEQEGEGLVYGIPVTKKDTPPVIPDKTNLNSKEATV